MHKKLIVIGGGPAGLAAAVSAVENGLSPEDICILERDSEPGGILNQCIHAGFGLHRFGEELTGPEYAGRYIEMAKAAGLNITVNAMVLSLTEDKKVTYVSPETGYVTCSADAVILAMGCRERTRGALNIPGSRPAGIFTAGTAQRYVNMEGYMPGREVVILGSGDIGLIMARRMTLEGAKVKVVAELLPYSGGLKRNIVQCLDDFDIPLKLSHTVVDIKGKERVEGITLAQVDENRRPIPGTEEYIECDTLLLSVSLLPENELSREAGIVLDRITGGAQVDETMQTSIPGIFACGNVLHVHDLVDFVTKEAYRAGASAAAYVTGNAAPVGDVLTTEGKNGVRYVMPQKLNAQGNLTTETTLFFRVDNIYRDRAVVLSVDGREIFRRKKRFLEPGQMESFALTEDAIAAIRGGKTVTVALD